MFDEASGEDTADIRVANAANLPAEAYKLRIDARGVQISASSDAGVFYALQTLRQLLAPAIYRHESTEQVWTVPSVVIEDEPRFA